MKLNVTLSSEENLEVEMPRVALGLETLATVDGEPRKFKLHAIDRDRVEVEIDGQRFSFDVARDPDGTTLRLSHRNRPQRVTVTSDLDRIRDQIRSHPSSSEPVTVYSALPGVVRQVFVKSGETVEAGAPLLTLEAMKMENEVRAEIAGRLEELRVEAGQVVAAREVLARIVPG